MLDQSVEAFFATKKNYFASEILTAKELFNSFFHYSMLNSRIFLCHQWNHFQIGQKKQMLTTTVSVTLNC